MQLIVSVAHSYSYWTLVCICGTPDKKCQECRRLDRTPYSICSCMCPHFAIRHIGTTTIHSTSIRKMRCLKQKYFPGYSAVIKCNVIILYGESTYWIYAELICNFQTSTTLQMHSIHSEATQIQYYRSWRFCSMQWFIVSLIERFSSFQSRPLFSLWINDAWNFYSCSNGISMAFTANLLEIFAY